MGNRTDYIVLDNATYPYTHQVRWDSIHWCMYSILAVQPKWCISFGFVSDWFYIFIVFIYILSSYGSRKEPVYEILLLPSESVHLF